MLLPSSGTYASWIFVMFMLPLSALVSSEAVITMAVVVVFVGARSFAIRDGSSCFRLNLKQPVDGLVHGSVGVHRLLRLWRS